MDDFWDLVIYWATRNMQQKDKDKFQSALFMPPPGATESDMIEAGPWSPEAEMSVFSQLA